MQLPPCWNVFQGNLNVCSLVIAPHFSSEYTPYSLGDNSSIQCPHLTEGLPPSEDSLGLAAVTAGLPCVPSITLSPWVDAADSFLGTEPLLWCSWWTVWQSCILSRLLADALVFYLKHPSKHLFVLFVSRALVAPTQRFQVCSSLLEPHPFSLEILQVRDHKETKHDKHLSFPDQDRGVRVKMSTNLTGNETTQPFPGRKIISSTMKTHNRWAPSILGLFTFL